MKQGHPGDGQGAQAVQPGNAVSSMFHGFDIIVCIRSSALCCGIVVFHFSSFFPESPLEMNT